MISLDETFVFVEPVGVEFTDEIGADIMFSGEAHSLVKYGYLRSDLATAVNSDSRHEFVSTAA